MDTDQTQPDQTIATSGNEHNADLAAALDAEIAKFGFASDMRFAPNITNGFMNGSDSKTGAEGAPVPAIVFTDQIDQIRAEMTRTTEEVAVSVSANGRSTRVCVFGLKDTAATEYVSTDLFDQMLVDVDAAPVPPNDARANKGKAFAMARVVAVQYIARMVADNR